MLVRWAIRGMCLGLLAVCVSGWVGSYWYGLGVRGNTVIAWEIFADRGAVLGLYYVSSPPSSEALGVVRYTGGRVEWLDRHIDGMHRWREFRAGVAEIWPPVDPSPPPEVFRFLGVPCWLATGLAALGVAWVWRRTAKPKLRAGFPVEVKGAGR